MKAPWILLLLPALLHAETNPPDLPPLIEVKKALSDYPAVKGAQAGIEAEKANAAILENGAYEYNVRMTGQQRRDTVLGRNMDEWDVIVERPIRLPGKSGIDQELGKNGIDIAELAAGDAMHESAKTLLSMWFSLLKEKLTENEWRKQAKLLSEEVSIVEKRVKAGDAPRLEMNLARSALLQAEYSATQAKMRSTVAAETLAANFPAIGIKDDFSLGVPVPMQESLEYWSQKILGHNHALMLARLEAKQSRTWASRVEADELPDPTVGIRYSSERGGSEKVMGGVLSFNLPGGSRRAASSAATARAEIAAQKEADALRKATADLRANYTAAKESYNGWEKSRDAALGMRKNADLVAQAYSLGEASLSDTLTARRLAVESRLAEDLARVDAIQMRYRLLLDAHLLWPLDAGE